MRTPVFWSQPGSPLGTILGPLGCAYGWAGALRQTFTTPARLDAAILCVGNLTAGGTGKTPVARSICAAMRSDGTAFLTRGYGGRQAGPVRVDPDTHDHEDVGDEALLLARTAPTWVARDRAAGARAAITDGARLIIMDDGFQNPSLAKDLALVVIDGETGFGNGRLIPAGPLREPVAQGLARADAAVIVGEDRAGIAARLPDALPRLTGRIRPIANRVEWTGRRVVAFAGIARPAKFFNTLEALGCEIAATHAFADHHRFTAAEIECIRASAGGATLVTTEKDAMRLPLAHTNDIETLAVELVWDDPSALAELVAQKIPAALA
ncbi:MAG: tetraacyldisaccharide 4'-kinase [Rhodospirillaceae bacterium]|nr:tetraacyldisaccharide 4'-kinase [Rhodospirillaceae bacterium]